MSRAARPDTRVCCRPGRLAAQGVAVTFRDQLSLGRGPDDVGQLRQRLVRQIGDVITSERNRQGLARQSFPAAERTIAGQHVLQDPLTHLGAFGIGERVFEVAPGAAEGALVTRLHPALSRLLRLFRREAGPDRNARLLFGEQDPVALRLGQVLPRDIDVIAQGHEDIAQVLPAPGHRPGGDSTLTDGQARVRHHAVFGHGVDPAHTVALRTGALWRIGRKVLGIKHRLVRRVCSGPRIKHSDKV